MPILSLQVPNKKDLKRHKCSFNPNMATSPSKPPLLTRPRVWEDTLKILRQLCIEDIVKLCQINQLVIHSIYPLCFPGNLRAGRGGGVPPILPEMSSFVKDRSSSLTILYKLVNLEGTVRLPQSVFVADSSTGEAGNRQ